MLKQIKVILLIIMISFLLSSCPSSFKIAGPLDFCDDNNSMASSIERVRTSLSFGIDRDIFPVLT